MTRLAASEFVDYFEALHGYAPFPWQERLAASIMETGAWPDLLDIPTGLGKTSAIDVALFVLAVYPAIAPRRIVMVVDRRVVVDQAAEHARQIQERLVAAQKGVLGRVANALRELWGGAKDDKPFEVAVLRGGMPRDEAWAHRPDRPVVALSTVDQVGSRLLFRGYGVSSTMAPVHAGLLGQDALILLDEVQLSTAFAETLRAIAERWRRWRERQDESSGYHRQIPDRWAFVRMSATPAGEMPKKDVLLTLDADDRAHPIVDKRLSASKLATLAEPIATSKTDAAKSMRAVVDAFEKQARDYLDSGARRIAVIVNRVATARRIHERLDHQVGKNADVVLLTGRMRPLDRDAIFGNAKDAASVAARVAAGGVRSPDHRPIIVVSTQTIEAGADFDFDGLVTECASIDALRQRFGRLDRRGDLKETRATILIRKDQVTASDDDPVYGAALSNTWNWLVSKAGKAHRVDFGIAHFPILPKKYEDRAALCSPVLHAPVMLPAHIDAWAQTQPRGEPDPDVALWLHGPQRGTAEVRVVWRADIDAAVLEDESRTEWVEEYAATSFTAVPPSSLEAISVPLPAVRAWLAKDSVVDIADVEGVEGDPAHESSDRNDLQRGLRPYLIVGKSEAKLHRTARELYADATIVVPASYGGIQHGNWNPDSELPVRDLGDVAQLLHRGRPTLRLIPRVLAADRSDQQRFREDEAASASVRPSPYDVGLSADAAGTVPRIPLTEDPAFDPREAVRAWLEESRELGSVVWRFVVAHLLAPGARLRIVELPAAEGDESGGCFAVVGKRVPASRLEALNEHVDLASDIVVDDDDSASYLGREVGLERHLGDVERWARTFAHHLGLEASLGGDLALAARLHDIGKADPRFQQILHGGSRVRMAASRELLAKSRCDARDRVARARARERANYPDGYRHELLSVAMLQHNPRALDAAADPELVLHLVGSHHGWCRPFAPALDHGPAMHVEFSLDGVHLSADTAHGLASPDSGVAERYWSLTERYGWWTLAWLEALIRLADHRASEESSRDDSGGRHSTSAQSQE